MSEYLHVEIEPTNICNTVCLHCPHDAISRPYGKMTWETYTAALDQVMARASHFSVEYAGMGEPLLNPLIYRFVAYVKGKGSASLTTTASALTAGNVASLIEAGLARLTISFNGDDKAIYELMMGGLNFERAMKNISQAVEASRGSSMVVAANVSVTRQVQGRLAEIKKYINDMGIEAIAFSQCHNRGGFLKGDLICNTPPLPALQSGRCDIFHNTLFVAWNGDVLACCHDLAGGTRLGNLEQEILAAVLQKKREAAAQGVHFSICQSCNDIYRLVNDVTADGRGIADLVYDLYANDPPASAALSPLAEWFYQLYAREGRELRVMQVLATKIQAQQVQLEQFRAVLADAGQQQQIQQQTQQALQAQLDAANQELQNILNSRSWRLIQRVQRLRERLIPPASRRERIFHKVLGKSL